MTQEEIIEKVRKLLRMSRSPNEHEARLAIEHALRLAEKHKIDVGTLELDSDLEKFMHQAFPSAQRLSHVAKLALNICTGFFHVSVVICRGEVAFIGTCSDVAIAHYVFGFVTNSCNRCLREFANVFQRRSRRKPSLNQRRNYVAGFFYGLRSHLTTSQEQHYLENAKFALVIAEQDIRRQQYKERLFPNTTSVNTPKMRRNWSAVMHGFHDGQRTTIHQPLDGSQPLLRLVP